MFTIEFFQNNSEKEKVGKVLSPTASYTGVLKEGSSIVNPVVLIENSGVLQGNYAIISEFSRSYFVSGITSVRQNLWEVSLKVDVLETYKEDIKKQSALVERQEYNYNNYLYDSQYPLLNDVDVITKKIGEATFGIATKVIAISASAVEETAESEV